MAAKPATQNETTTTAPAPAPAPKPEKVKLTNAEKYRVSGLRYLLGAVAAGKKDEVEALIAVFSGLAEIGQKLVA